MNKDARQRVDRAVVELWSAMCELINNNSNELRDDDFDLMFPVTKHRALQDRLDNLGYENDERSDG